jgi:aryl-alcohol dehydrogenase-like predicted oxidoreductase
MEYRPLGTTNIRVSALAFGAGPVPDLMTGGEPGAQLRAVQRAIELGINWFDTAPGYGSGQSEQSLGAALAELGHPAHVHVATKIRLRDRDFADIPAAVETSIRASLARLQCERVTLLQVHNAITARRGDEPDSITPDDVLGPRGLLEALQGLQRACVIEHLGLTGTGSPQELGEVIRSRAFATIQIPYHLLNPSAAQAMPADFRETDFGNVMQCCREHGVGVLAIRVFAGGALLGNPPSKHTFRTPYFPLPLYERDQRHAALVAEKLPEGLTIKEAALRFVLSSPGVATAIVGFGDARHVDEAVAIAAAGPLSPSLMRELQSLVARTTAAN